MRTIGTLLLLAVFASAYQGLCAEEKKPVSPAGAKSSVVDSPGGDLPGGKVEYAGDYQEPAGPADAPDGGLVGGYRGAAIEVRGSQLLFVKKGDRVDVLVTFEALRGDRKEKMTATILQNVIVINAQKPERMDGRGVIELLVNPNEAQYLALSSAQGDTSIAVRAPGDFEMHPMEMASFRKLIK